MDDNMMQIIVIDTTLGEGVGSSRWRWLCDIADAVELGNYRNQLDLNRGDTKVVAYAEDVVEPLPNTSH